MALEVNSVPWSLTIMLGLPRRPIRSVSSRATRRPEIEVTDHTSGLRVHRPERLQKLSK